MDHKLNTVEMNAPHNINEPFEMIIDQIETAIDFKAQAFTCAHTYLHTREHFKESAQKYYKNQPY